MKFEDNWQNTTLEELEKQIWPPLEESGITHLIRTCHALRKKPLKDFSVEDLRIMIGQDIGLEYLIPLAIRVLSKNILAEGDYYEGDLLKNVLTSDKNYWKKWPENWRMVCELIQRNGQILSDFDTTAKIKKDWFDSFKEFKSYDAED